MRDAHVGWSVVVLQIPQTTFVKAAIGSVTLPKPVAWEPSMERNCSLAA